MIMKPLRDFINGIIDFANGLIKGVNKLYFRDLLILLCKVC